MDELKPRMVCDLCRLGNHDTCYVGGVGKCLKNKRYTKFELCSAQPENKPLALDELRELFHIEPNKIYEPIWIKILGNGLIFCYTADRSIRQDYRFKVPYEWVDTRYANLKLSDYGKTWAAYRSKPEVDK